MTFYVLYSSGFYKLGISSNLPKRLKQYNCHNPSYTILLQQELKTKNAIHLEKQCLDFLKQHRQYKNDWIKLSKKDWKSLERYISTASLPFVNIDYILQNGNPLVYLEKQCQSTI